MTRTPLLALFLCVAGLSAAADESPASPPLERVIEIDREPQRCLSRSGLRRTAVVDERTVIFVRRQGIWLNVLGRACPGLAPGTGFAYEVSGRVSRLCRRDLVSPGLSLRSGGPCALGDFYEISASQAQALLSPIEQWRLDRTIGVRAVAPPSE